MEKNEFEKKLGKYLKGLTAGDEDFYYYRVGDTDMVSTVGEEDVKPHTLIVYWQAGTRKISKGFLNYKNLNMTDEDINLNNNITVIANLTNKKKIEVLFRVDKIKEVYSEGYERVEERKLLVFRENKDFTDIILLDSSVCNTISYISSREKITRNYLKNICLSLLCSMDTEVHKKVLDSMVE